jgi:predicted acetyltransferase
VEVVVVAAAEVDRERLLALSEFYVYDLSDVMPFDLAEDGRFSVFRVDAYFANPRRHAFVVRVDGRLAGFALVHNGSRLSEDESIFDMAEFFVMRKYRGQGVGARAAVALFERFRGRWEVRQRAENQPATQFWRKVVARYTGGRFEELIIDDERWRGPVQCFDSASAAGTASR